MEELMKILKSIRADVDFENEKQLIDEGVLDSMDIVAIVADINEHYGIDIDVDDLEAENFNSAENILRLINELK